MGSDSSTQLQVLIDRIRGGDAAARRELVERAYRRLRGLAAAMLHRHFPALAGRHDVESVLHDTWLRLLPALDEHPPTVADFFRLAAHKVRQVLLDLAERQRRHDARERAAADDSSKAGPDATDWSGHPGRLAAWTEFHEQAARLPEPQRHVFELHYYLDLTQAEIATLLNLHPRQVSRLWVAAADRLAAALPDPDGPSA